MTGPGWEAIRAEVLHRIRRRDWPPGAVIPGETALAQEFGCARATVARALRDLAGAGVLERRRKSGTRVTALPVRKATLDIAVIRQEIEARGQTHAHRLLTQRNAVPPLPVAARMRCREDRPILYLETLHLADGLPFAFETRWLDPAGVGQTLPDFARVTANEWLVANVNYVTGDIAFSAEGATTGEARVLGVSPGTALFITERSTWAADGPITHVRLAHAPGYRVQTLV